MSTYKGQKKYKVIDLFSGAGGLSYGFLQTGLFDIVAAAENNIQAQETYKRNHKDVKMFNNVTEITSDTLDTDNIDVVIGGPPCQGFSNANRQKNTVISMNNHLVKEYVRIISEIKPKVFVMENVSMLKSSIHRFYLDKDDKNLQEKGIKITEDIIELLPHEINLDIIENANDIDEINSIITDKEFRDKYQWSSERYSLFNNIYKMATQKTNNEEEFRVKHEKLINRILKHKKLLFLESNKILSAVNSENQIQKFDSYCAEYIIKLLDNPESLSEEKLCSSFKNSILIQRMIGKWLELIDNKIVINSYEKNNGFSAKVNSYAILDYIKVMLSSEPYNYKIISNILNAAEFGVPQKRMRYVIIGCQSKYSKKLSMPAGIFKETEFRTVEDAISDISDEIPFSNLDSPPIKLAKKLLQENSLAFKLRDSEYLYNHINTATRKTAKERFENLSEGENFHSLPKELKTTYTKGERTQNTIYLKLEYKKPSGTVVNIRKSMWIHPKFSRALSIREAARLQTFPDSFIFTGTKDSQYQQVGNAVPPILGEAIGQKVASILNGADVDIMN